MHENMPDFRELEAAVGKDERFERFFALLAASNERFNLTAITDREEVIHKHFLDSLAGAFLFPRGARCVEIGSGAGFPSIPLKLYREDLTFTLIESTGKKCAFLERAVKELGLGGVDIVQIRAEEAGRREEFRERFDVAFARAVARYPALCEYCLPLVRQGGRMIAYKSDAAEIAEGRNAVRLLGGEIEREISYELPDAYGKRLLAVAVKKRNTPPCYPRGKGLERKQPL